MTRKLETLDGSASGTGRSLTLADDVERRMHADIVSGRLSPGEKLGFEMLRERYGAGLSPIREALQRLTSENLVVTEGHVGFRVAPVSLEDLRDINTLRRLLEVEALRGAIASGDVHWEGRVLAAHHQLSRMPIPADPHSDDAERWEEGHREFHEVLISACPSRWTLHFCRILFSQFRRYRRIILKRYWQSTPVRSVVDQEHNDLVRAVIARDSDKAASLLLAHYDNSAKRVVAEYERLHRPVR